MSSAEIVLVVPHIGACSAQSAHHLSTEGIVRMAMANEYSQLLRHLVSSADPHGMSSCLQNTPCLAVALDILLADSRSALIRGKVSKGERSNLPAHAA